MGFVLDEEDFKYPEDEDEESIYLDPKNCLIDITVDSSDKTI
jgi:hypothetical protein